MTTIKTGRKRLPTAIKVANGTYREDRDYTPRNTLNNPLIDAPPPPSTLGDEGQQRWVSTMQVLLDMRVVCNSDLQSLEMYCSAFDMLAECNLTLATTGQYTVSNSGTIVLHPAVNQRFKTLDIIRRYMTEFGLTPSSRASLEVSPKKISTNIKVRKRG